MHAAVSTLPDRITTLPCWQGAWTAEPMAGGLSNEIWKVTDAAGPHVVRMGQDYPVHHVFRTREVMTARAAHAAGFAPAVEYAEPGVMVTAFVGGQSWTAAHVAAEPERLGRLLGAFHRTMGERITGAPYLFWPFQVIRDYAVTLTGTRHDAATGPARIFAQALESCQVPQPMIFGHNDMLPANVLDDGARLWLIDFEYAGFSSPLFDLAGVAANAGLDSATSEALTGACLGHSPDSATGRALSAMRCAAALRETLWALVSDLHLAAPGVDYLAYAAQNQARLDAELDLFQSRYGKLLP